MAPVVVVGMAGEEAKYGCGFSIVALPSLTVYVHSIPFTTSVEYAQPCGMKQNAAANTAHFARLLSCFMLRVSV